MQKKMIKNKISMVLILVIGIGLPLSAAKFVGWCVKVHSGDMVMIWSNKKKVNVRLASIDSPDEGQPFAEEARKWMKEKVFRKKVTVEIQSYEGEEYLVGTVRLGEADLSLQLVEAGLAWYDKKLGANRDLSKAQKRARKAKIGLWAQEDPVPPWDIKARSEKEKAAAEEKKKKEN
jgi:endonuclease YncB( thermonuclease family)